MPIAPSISAAKGLFLGSAKYALIFVLSKFVVLTNLLLNEIYFLDAETVVFGHDFTHCSV